MRIRSFEATITELLLLCAAGMMAAAGLGRLASVPAGVGMAVCWALTILGAGVAAWRWGRDRDLRAADRITLARGFATSLVAAGAVSAPELSDGQLWLLAGMAAIALVTDGVDGFVARRSRSASEFGARMDREVDAFTTLVLAILVFRLGHAGIWVIASGLMRYVFVAAGSLWPWLRADLPPSRRRQTVCVIQVATLVACIPPWMPAPWPSVALLAALAALSWSFACDIAFLARKGRTGPAADAERSARSARRLR